jgi:hypothetical protein
MRFTLWQCEICKDEFVTDNKSRYQMVGCKCGKSAVDDEEGYTRTIGKPKKLKTFNKTKQR